jgi:hypothetical protein
MNIIELANDSGIVYYGMGKDRARFIHHLENFAHLVAAAARADERELIKKAVEELNPVENNPLLQNKPASFWIQNFKQIVFERGTT